jgi:hypothetical protein
MMPQFQSNYFRKISLAMLSGALLLASSPCMASSTMALYLIFGLSANSTSQGPEDTATNLSASILGNPEILGRKPTFSFGWDEPNALGASVWTDASSRNDDQFFAAALRAESGFLLQIQEIEFSWGSRGQGPTKLDLTMQLGNSTNLGDETLLHTFNLGTAPSGITTTIASTAVTMAPTTELVIFRFYAYAGGNVGSTNEGGFYDPTSNATPVQFLGEVTPIPEPSAGWLLSALGATLLFSRVRRRA